MYHDGDNNVVSEPGRFHVESLSQSISVSANYKILNFEPYRTQSHAIPDIRYEYSNSLIGIANIISYTVYAYIYIILLPEWHRN